MNENRYFGYRSFEPEYETMKEMRDRHRDRFFSDFPELLIIVGKLVIL